MTEAQTGDLAYRPMQNDRAEFDPASGPWAYISDDFPPQRWRALVAMAARHATWPFAARDAHNKYWYARLSPDWCHYSWGSEYVGAEWDPARPSAVTARLSITRRPRGWTLNVTLDLAARTYSWEPRGAAGMSDDAVAEAEIKCGKQNLAARIVWKRTSAHSTARNFGRVHDRILAYRRTSAAPWCHPGGQMILAGHGDVWLDIPPLNGAARERLGYPTQKPLPLLTRLLALAAGTGGAQSDPGIVVLDPNCGSGTTIEAAHRLGYGWIGIDLSGAAISLTAARLRAGHAVFEVRG